MIQVRLINSHRKSRNPQISATIKQSLLLKLTKIKQTNFFHGVLVIFGGFGGTTLSTGKQKRIPAEVPALEGLLYSYKQSL